VLNAHAGVNDGPTPQFRRVVHGVWTTTPNCRLVVLLNMAPAADGVRCVSAARAEQNVPLWNA